MKGEALRRAGVLAGILAGPFFLVSVGLNTWASVGYLHQLGWELVGGEQVPWPSSLAAGSRLGANWTLLYGPADVTRIAVGAGGGSGSRSCCSPCWVWR